MKSNGLIFLFLLIWGCSHSVDPEAKITNSAGESYFGKVKSIEEMNYDKNKKRLSIWKWKYQNGFIHLYNRKGLEIKAFFKNGWGEQSLSWQKYYDINGRLTKTVYGKDSFVNTRIANPFIECHFVYWPGGQLREEQRFTEYGKLVSRKLFNENGTKNEFYEFFNNGPYPDYPNFTKKYYNYKYDEYGRIIEMEEKFTTAGYREYSVYKYNSNGHQELRTLIGGNGKPVSQKQITFDLNGNELIYTTIFDHLNPDHNYTFIKEYDENNKLIREMVNSKNGELLSDTHYYFDEKNCLIRETTLFGNPEEGYSSNEIIYENKYDRKNNLIRQIRFTNGVPDKLTKWKIKYYFC